MLAQVSRTAEEAPTGELALYALIIFVTFAIVGGLVVRYIVKHQTERDDGLPPRGVPWDAE